MIIASGGNENFCDLIYEVTRYPAGEIEVSITKDISGVDIFIFHRIKVDAIHDSLFEIFLVALRCRDLGARSVSLIIPYLPYSRCEKTSLKYLYSILEAVGIKKIITADIHSDCILTKIPIHSISFASLIITELNIDLKEKLIISPDRGGYNRAKKVAGAFGCDFICLDKIRVGDVVEHILEFDVAGRDVIIVDDIIDSGRTINGAVRVLKDNCVKSVEVIATHIVRIPDLNQVDYVYTTDSVRHPSYPEKFRILKLQRDVFWNTRHLI